MVMTVFERFPRDVDDISAANVGFALAGLVAREASGVPRVGMLGVGPAVAAVAASWKVQVGEFVYVHQVARAVSFSGLSAAEQVDIVPATGIPAGQARIDVVCWDQVAAALTVVPGAPSTSPVVPSSGGLSPVARVRVNSGDGQVVAGQVSRVFAKTQLVDSVPEVTPYVPVVAGYTSGFAPVVRAQYTRMGDVVEVEVQAVTDREVARFVGLLSVTTPFPIGSDPVSVDGGGYFLIGPTGAKRIRDLRVRQASSSAVVLELLGTAGVTAERVPILQGGFASTDWVSWRARFRYTVG